jgi:hypothetical protein
MLTYDDVCGRMRTYADAAGDGVEGSLDHGIAMLTYANICRRMQTYADDVADVC